MKKILSFFMVAVLSLNLLYQPCMAADDNKDTASDVTQQSPDVGCKIKQPEKQLKQKKNKAASKEESYYDRFLNVVSLIVGAFMIYCVGYLDGYEDKYNAGEHLEEKGLKAAKCRYCKTNQNGANFPVDNMSKKCLKHTLIAFHPDKSDCYEYIKDFYMKVQETYEKER